uniref:Uncharacterized protein n=1 Tax=Lepeophtheirus salmonis TaxID=72036 RepID=A0A0K2SVR6_LEPSM
MERKSSFEERSSRPRPEILARRSMSICSANILSPMPIPSSPIKNEINDSKSSNKTLSNGNAQIQRRKFGIRSKTVMDCHSYMENKQSVPPKAKRSSSVKDCRMTHSRSSGRSSPRTPQKSPSDQSMGSKTWDTTEKVLGVHTVLGTAGLTSTSLITIPSLGGGIVGGCAAAALGVATAASFVTGVGVIAGLGVAGVQYAKAKHKKVEEEKEEETNQRSLSTSSFSDQDNGDSSCSSSLSED